MCLFLNGAAHYALALDNNYYIFFSFSTLDIPFC